MWLLILACAHPGPVPPPAPEAIPEAVAPASAPDAEAAEIDPGQPFPVIAEGHDDPVLQGLVEAARSDDTGLQRLAQLCDDYPRRLAGTEALEGAVQWTKGLFEADGQDNVRLDEVMVPAWKRGHQRVAMTVPHAQPLTVLTLGNSVGTEEPIEAPVVLIRDFAELGPEVEGKIVLYNVPMGQSLPSIANYGPAVQYRSQGASRAAEHGALAVLVRSVATHSLYTPHTGGLRYDEAQPKIPGVAVTTEDADWMSRLIERGQEVRVSVDLGAHFAEDALSHNVIAEIQGSDKSEEIVLISGHLDAWDVGCGAYDDGAGIVETIEALRLIRAQGLTPRRTIRAVLFTNEENGLRGGKAYAETHGEDGHVVALESDLGAGWPLGMSMSGTAPEVAWVSHTLAPLGIPITEGGGGADISPLYREAGVPMVGLRPDDSIYFHLHHTEADTFDKVDPEAFREATAAWVGATWLLANADGPPPKATTLPKEDAP